MNKKFAIFDMDGTLVDSMGYWQQLGREFLTGKAVTGDIDGILQRTKPMTMEESSALFVREFGLPGTPESVMAEMNSVMDSHYRKDVLLKPGVEAYLEALRQRGVSMCVASATPEPLVRICLERLGIAHYFSFLLSCDAVGVGKSRPDVYLEAARRLGAQPCETAVYEDALFAAETARDAGFYVAAVYDDGGAVQWDRLRMAADEAITDWSEAARSL